MHRAGSCRCRLAKSEGLTSPALRDWPAFGAVGGGAAKPIFRAVRERYRPMIPAAKSDALNRPARSLSTEEARVAAKSASSSRRCTVQIIGGVRLAEVSGICSLSAGCPHLSGRLSSPPLECMRKCTHFVKAEQPRNLGYMQLGVIKVSNCQVAPQLLKYFSKVQPFVRKPSCKRPLAHSQAASNVIHHHPSMRKQRRYRVLNSRAQLAYITSSIG